MAFSNSITSSVQSRHAHISSSFKRCLYRKALEILFLKNHKLHWKLLPNAGILMLYLSVKIRDDLSKLRFPLWNFHFGKD